MPSRLTGVSLVFIAAMAWSTAGLFTRVVTTDIPTTLFWRSLIGGFCVLGIYLCMQRRRSGRVSLREAMRLSRGEVVVGALSTAGMICFISSFFHTTIANVSFVYGAMPLVTFLLALVALKERVDWSALGVDAFMPASSVNGRAGAGDRRLSVTPKGAAFLRAALGIDWAPARPGGRHDG